MPDEIKVPPAPAVLPAKLQEQWKKTWLKEFKQAQIDKPNDETEQVAIANKLANRILSPDEPESYEEAMALPDWQIMHRGEKKGKLWVVLINAKKFSFDIPPEKAAKPSVSASSNGSGPDLLAMTKAELVSHAAARGITVDANAKKEDIIAQIAAAGK